MAEDLTVTQIPASTTNEYSCDIITAISKDGSSFTAVTGASPTVPSSMAFYNTTGGWTFLPDTNVFNPFYNGGATSLSADGTLQVGFSEGFLSNADVTLAGYWSQGSAWNNLTLPSGTFVPYSQIGSSEQSPTPIISGDGSKVLLNLSVGFVYGPVNAYVGSLTGGSYTNLGNLNASDPGAVATAMSYDGSVVVGYSAGQNYLNGYPYASAFIWTVADGIQDLGLPTGKTASQVSGLQATCMSKDGAIVYGEFANISDRQEHAFRWTQATGMVDIDPDFQPTSCSGDGSIVVGFASTTSADKLWTPNLGKLDLGLLCNLSGSSVGTLSEHLNGETYLPVISEDGSSIVCTQSDSNNNLSNIEINLGSSLTPADTVASVSLSPSSVYGGYGTTGTVTLTLPAPSGGFTVNLTPTQPGYVGTPATVTVLAGHKTATFAVTTNQSPVTYISLIRAYTATSAQQAALTVNAYALSTLTLSPNPVYGGSVSMGTVTLTSQAPSTGILVKLNSQLNDVTVPSSVMVLSGQTSATFMATTTLLHSTYNCKILASLNSSKLQSTLGVNTYSISSLSLNPSVTYGSLGSTGTITLSAAAPPSGLTVMLTSSKPSYVEVPSSVPIAGGATTATFPITTSSYGSDYSSIVQASVLGSTQQVTLNVDLYTISSVTLNPSSVYGGFGSTGTVTLVAPAPAGGITVNLSSSKPSYVGVPVSVTIPAGAMSVPFAVTTQPFSSSYSCFIGASITGSSQQTTLMVNAYSLSSLILNPSTVVGGSGSTGTVTLTTPAPSGGITVSLSSSNPFDVGMPSSVTIPAGASSVSFSITTSFQIFGYTSNISASLPGSNQHSTLTVNP